MAAKLATQILTPVIHRFISDWVTSIALNPQDPPMPDLKYMARYDPVSGLSIQLVNLYVLAAMGEYTHPKKRIEKQVRSAIVQCRGSWKASQEQLLSFIPFGRSVAEVAHDISGTKATLKEIRILDPERYFFEGSRGEIDYVVYRGNTDIRIPYDRVIHLVNEPHIAFGDPLGVSALARAYPYWKLHQILMPILATAAQRQGTPVMVIKTNIDGSIELRDENGMPIVMPDGTIATISKGEDAKKAIEALSSAGGLVVDREDDVIAVDQKVAADFLMGVIKVCEQYRMMSYLVPSTIASFSSSGVGDAGLATSQREVFEAISASRASYLAEGIIERVIKPMIIFNYGEQDSYGEFPVSTKDPTALLVAELIAKALEKKTFAPDDIDAINRLRDLLGLEPLKEIDLQKVPEVSPVE